MMQFNKIKNALAQIYSFQLFSFQRLSLSAFLLSVVLSLPVIFATSCAESSSEKAGRVGGITAQQIIENPSAYVGKTVTVSGDVEEIHGPRAFNMDSGASRGELLVVGREPFPQVTNNGADTIVVFNDVATVTGVVRMFVAADVEREIGWDLDPKIESDFNAKPVLIAQSVSFKPGANRGSKSGMPMNQNSSQTAAAADNNAVHSTNSVNNNQTGNAVTDTGVYTSTADKISLADKTAEFSDVLVVRIVGPRTFTILSGKDEIFVMLDDASPRGVGTEGKIGIGKKININGKFERLQAEEINDISNNRFRPLTDEERAFLKKTEVYLLANQVGGLK